MVTIFNMVLLLLYVTSIVSLASATINGVKRDNAKALWNCALGLVFLVCAGAWHWFYFKSGHAFVALFRESVDEIMFDITFTVLDIGLPRVVTQIIRFVLVTIPYWIEIALAFLALKGGDSATACMLEAEAAEKAKQAALRAERYAKNRARVVVLVVVGIGFRFGGAAVSNLVNKTFEPGSGVWQSSPLESVNDFGGSYNDLSDEDEQKAEYMMYRQQGGSWSFDEWTRFLDEVRACEDEAGLMSLSEELEASGFKASGGFDFGSFVQALKTRTAMAVPTSDIILAITAVR